MKPKLLLHACCAPCSVAIIDEIRSAYDLTVLFYNPNIYPLAEYDKRKAEVIRVCGAWSVPFVDLDRDHGAWERSVAPIVQEKEGGARCSACYRLRLERAAEFARSEGFDLFGTSLTMGRRKKSAVINAIGAAVGELRGVNFLDENWKKKGRIDKALKIVAEMGIYRQSYCGCRFSLDEALAKSRQAATAGGAAAKTRG